MRARGSGSRGGRLAAGGPGPAALLDRPAGMSLTDAFVGALAASMDGFDLLDDELAAHVATTFAAMVKQTPALHAHWLEIQDRLARVAAEQLALQAGTEPADPELAVADWALPAWSRSTWTRGYVTSAPASAALSLPTRSPATYAKPQNCWRPDWHHSAAAPRPACATAHHSTWPRWSPAHPSSAKFCGSLPYRESRPRRPGQARDLADNRKIRGY